MTRARRATSAIMLAAVLGVAPASFAALRYVNANLTTGLNNGASWANAYQGSGGLSAALGASGSGDDIWVAQGTYKPTAQFASGGDQDKTFKLLRGVRIYGGFAGSETALNQRHPLLNLTYLSGDIDNDNVLDADNVWHVVRIQSPSEEDEIIDTTHLDGFIVTMGYADHTDVNGLDGYGAGLLVAFASPVIKNCTFINNKAVTLGGGGAHVEGTLIGGVPHSFARFYSCRFLGNDSDAWAGGLCNKHDRTELYNCVFSGNHADGTGGALYNVGGDAEMLVVNCSFFDNDTSGSAGSGGAIYNSRTLDVRNSILWSNAPDHIATSGTGTIVSDSNVGASDPLFVDADGPDEIVGTLDDNLRLLCASPSRNAGSNSWVEGDSYDVDDDGVTGEATPTADRETRIMQTTVDQGAYEMVSNVCPANIDTTTTGSETSVDINDLLALIGQWGPCPPPSEP